MALVYLDDNFPTHPKVINAMAMDPLAPWLFVCGLAYCRRYLKGDGVIPELAVPTLMPLYKPRMRKALFDVALWEPFADGWLQVHDYEFWNHTEDAQREARKEKASRAASAMWEKKRLAQINGRVGGQVHA